MAITEANLLLAPVLLFLPFFHRASLAGNVDIIELLLSKVGDKKIHLFLFNKIENIYFLLRESISMNTTQSDSNKFT